ncbi:pyruvate dehydrogenase (acetyl-transferring) E1 component subunit alpha [candidate division KSB1 bacterium]|nr:MAG: pyruvate dehydrogenase (acetyl-transferring) E1 component subunit alpha [candidate division KSB1 bacterium]
MNPSSSRTAEKPAAPPDNDFFSQFDPLVGKKLGILNEDGTLVAQALPSGLDDEKLLAAYRIMTQARVADLKAVSLQRQGRLFTLPPNMGQEACAVGSALALEAGDWLVPAYRELGALLVRGVPLSRIYMYHGGSEYGSVYPPEVRVLPPSVPISSQLLHAVGIGHAVNYLGGCEVVMTYFGDGGTSEGDFHEALNWAAVFNCPVVFFCNNNQYAISQPRARQTKSKTIAQKAIAYGMPGIQVDGNDLPAVYYAAREAVNYARSGKGPVLIEAETYRLAAHTTSDDPSKYRTSEEEEKWKGRDPLIRMRKYLESKNLWNDSLEEKEKEEAARKADEAFREAEAFPPNSPDEIINHVYEQPNDELRKQAESLKSFLKWKEGR